MHALNGGIGGVQHPATLLLTVYSIASTLPAAFDKLYRYSSK